MYPSFSTSNVPSACFVTESISPVSILAFKKSSKLLPERIEYSSKVMSNFSFTLDSADFVLASLALFIIPLLPSTKFILTPASISKTTIVTTSAINVIPLLCFVFVLCLL